MATRKPHAADRSPHLDAERLAALAEGGLGEVEARAADAHLLTCRECMAAYADVLRLHHEWTRSPGSRAADADLRELGYGLFPGTAVAGEGDGPAARPRSFPVPRRGGGRRWLVAAVLPLLLVAGAAWVGLRTGGMGEYAPAADVVIAASAEVSHHGMLLPGTGEAAWSPGARYRAPGHADPDLEAALAGLASHARDPRARYLRAQGLLAAGNLDLARVLTETARRSDPGDLGWRSLAAVVAYRENDLAAAEMLLRGVLADAPTEREALFNLGLVLAADGRTDEALRIFRSLTAGDGNSLLGRRARAEVQRLAG